jgi:hypothetical protein
MLTSSTRRPRANHTAQAHIAPAAKSALPGPWERRHPACSGLARSIRRKLRRGPGRIVACFVLISSLIICPLPASSARPSDARALASTPASPPDAAFISWLKRLLGRGKATPQQESPADRASHVSSIKINPPKQVGHQAQQMALRALPLDSAGRIVHGIRVSWSSSSVTTLTVDERGFATLLQPGVAWATASAGTVTARVPILVLSGSRTMQTDAQWDAEQAKLNPDGTLTTGVGANDPGLIPSLLDKLAPTVHAQTGGGDSGDFGYDELWSTPANLVGNPRNRVTEQTNIGSVLPEGSNFNVNVPIWSLPGRGVPVSLNLTYNSRIWSRHSNAVTFNAVNTWPYLGFTLGFGRIVTYGSDPNNEVLADRCRWDAPLSGQRIKRADQHISDE